MLSISNINSNNECLLLWTFICCILIYLSMFIDQTKIYILRVSNALCVRLLFFYKTKIIISSMFIIAPKICENEQTCVKYKRQNIKIYKNQCWKNNQRN